MTLTVVGEWSVGGMTLTVLGEWSIGGMTLTVLGEWSVGGMTESTGRTPVLGENPVVTVPLCVQQIFNGMERFVPCRELRVLPLERTSSTFCIGK
jgi:hypothetical protein